MCITTAIKLYTIISLKDILFTLSVNSCNLMYVPVINCINIYGHKPTRKKNAKSLILNVVALRDRNSIPPIHTNINSNPLYVMFCLIDLLFVYIFTHIGIALDSVDMSFILGWFKNVEY